MNNRPTPHAADVGPIGRVMSLTEKILNVRPDRPLFHYTSASGLLGILSSGSIWATHIAYLNDMTEFVHGMSIVREVIEGRFPGANAADRPYYEAVLKNLDRMNKLVATNTYVSSFCEAEDELSLWRGYCPHNAGYAFGFDWRQDTDETSIITRCVYDNELKRGIVEEQLDTHSRSDVTEVRQRYANSKVPNTLSVAEWRAIAFTEMFYTLAPSFKHSSFKEEREWRLVVMQPSEFRQSERFRPSDTMLIPYLEHSLLFRRVLQVDKIVVGPTSHPYAAGHAIERFLHSWLREERPFQIQCKAVQLSRVPYRRV